MYTPILLKHIHDMNLSYLLLAASLINHDTPTALFRLGVSKKVAEKLGNLTLTQMQKLSNTNQLICKFRFTDINSISCLTKDSRLESLQEVHTGILLSTVLMNEISEDSDKENR